MYYRSLLSITSVLSCCILAQADAPPPPLGENLVGDCTFTDPLESTPWQAESGALADMLCPSGGCGNCAEQVNVLRFRGRDTDDILAVRQQLALPLASSFELSFSVKYCDTAPTGILTVTLGSLPECTLQIQSRPSSGIRRYVHVFENGGEVPVQAAGDATLVIANPALSGADILVDDVRIVPRFTERECALDPALFGNWHRHGNTGNASKDTWSFWEDGMFSLDSMQGYYDGGDPECCVYGTEYYGVWCVDATQNPPAIYLRVDSESYYESKGGKKIPVEKDAKSTEPDCGAPERAWYGQYQIGGDQLALRVQECPDPTFDSPPIFSSSGFESHNGSPLIAPCETPEGEGSADLSLLGTWGRGVCGKELELPKHEWSFEEDGDFVEVVVAANAGWIDQYRGTYTVNLETIPAQIDLHYTLKETYDDVVEEGEPCDCGGGCFIDSCEALDFTKLGVFEIVGTALNLVTDDCRPESTLGALEHTRDDLFCVSEEALGVYNPAPGECSEEGEGAALTCEGGGTVDPDLLGPPFMYFCYGQDFLTWVFSADGTFLEENSGTSEGPYYTWLGTYSVDLDVTPHRMRLHYCQACVADDEIETYDGECPPETLGCVYDTCSDFAADKHALYEVDNGLLKLVVEDTPPATLDGAVTYSTDVDDICPGHIEGEGEGAALTCESGGPVDPDLLGPQFTRFCPDQDGLGWAFSERGTFREDNWGTQEGPYLTWLGTYSVDLDVTPHRMRLHYCHACVADDEVNEVEAECPWESGLMGCYDACSDYVTDKHALYEVENGLLTLVVADTPPATLDGAVIYRRNNEDTCPGHIEGEGEGQSGPSLADIIEGFLAADINDDRALSRTEAEALSIPTALFDSIDANEDGFIHVGEAFWAAGDTAPRHTSDQDLDGVIDLGELLRAIQFYNAGGYSCAPFGESEDAYLPQPYAGGGVDPACPAHASDYNPADGRVSLSELLRIIQLFNASNYTACPGSGEDGFCLS